MKDNKWLEKLETHGFICGCPMAECMDGMQEDIMEKIDEWCDDLDASCNILWIRGFPGVGKSAIAQKLASKLKFSHHLGWSFFFQHELVTVQTPVNFWHTVAFDLFCEYPSARSAIITKLKDNEIDLENIDAKELFRSLIKDPLKQSSDILLGSLPVVVIDGIDECSGLDGSRSKHWKILLEGFKTWTRLGPQFKLVVTSHPEDDIF